jgi:acyl-[acyl-carrier-protein]-phospholipid O-acyltransferase/long-chain-fatty-acid--[acyl-carrier-protein] ligase
MSLLEHLVRFVSRVLVRTFYKLEVHGTEHIPRTGGALLLCNHSSYADPSLLDAAAGRSPCFVMYRGFYNLRWLRPLCRICRTVPISPQDSISQKLRTFRQARALLRKGEIVCVFPEGGMTRNGNMRAFKAGYELMLKGTDCKIIPAYVGGSWKSIFSYYYGKPVTHLPRRFRPGVSVHFGAALPGETTPHHVRQKVMELSCDYFNSLKSPKRSLVYRFIKTAHKNRRRRCICDSSGRRLNYSRTLDSVLLLADKLKPLIADSDKVGILLPPSVGAVLANIAVTLLGRVPVNLNYTLSSEAVNSAVEQCNIKCVISSAKFLEKSPEPKKLANLAFLEDIARTVTVRDKLKAFVKSRFCPAGVLAGISYRSCDNAAAIIFSSGSGGKPKGVMLSHHNIISDIDSMCSIFRLRRDDSLCAVLPFFHSFGFTCSLWLPILNGVSAAFVPNPLDGKAVGQTARENGSTVLFAAPTFLNSYIKRAEPQDFATLRFVMCGGEELKETIADAFEMKFGIRSEEGYGATELSPVVSFNIYDVDIGGAGQVGSKRGTVGHPIPGIAAKVVDPETKETLGIDQQGLLMIKGPTVMLGYLNNKEKTDEVVRNGWYCTGDIVSIDEDGFIKVTGRSARFSKIGGEMVPHVAIESICHRLLNSDQQFVAVTAVPDERKGEEIVVLYLASACGPDELHKIITQSDLPNLYKPKRENYIAVEKIPTLGSGKLDLAKIKQIALRAKTPSKPNS